MNTESVAKQIAGFLAKYDPAVARTLDEPRVAALLRAALARAKTPLPATGRARTIIKAISAKQRPRRASS